MITTLSQCLLLACTEYVTVRARCGGWWWLWRMMIPNEMLCLASLTTMPPAVCASLNFSSLRCLLNPVSQRCALICTYNTTNQQPHLITFFWTVRSCTWAETGTVVTSAQLCCAGQGMRPGAAAVCRALEFRANCSTSATGLGPHQALLTADCRGNCIAETERTLVSSVLSLHPAKLCCYSQHFAGPVWVACCSAVLDSPTNGTCSCVLLPQLLGTLDKETMLPCTDRGSAHN